MTRRGMGIFIGILLMLLLITVKTDSINNEYENKVAVEQHESLMLTQQTREGAFDIEGYTLENPNVIVDPYGVSPLSALVLFETEEEVSINITVVGKNELTTFKGDSPKGLEHYVPIYGLYPGKDTEVVIETDDYKKVLQIRAEDLPNDFALPTEVMSNKDEVTDDLYFFTPASEGYTSAYDINGDVRWYLTEKMSWDISRLDNGRLMLSTERPINPPYFTTGLYEVDLLGKIYNEFNMPGGYHHDYFEMKNGNLLVASNDFDNKDGTVEDYIVEIDRQSGDIVKSWDLKDELIMTDGKSENWSEYDWFHNNSVWYDEKDDVIILSGRHQDAVVAIDYESGKPSWIIGDPTNWSQEYQHLFFKPVGDEFEWQWSQHAAMVTPEGYIFILDNGNNKSKIEEDYVSAEDSYTRGVMYDINTDKMTIEQVWEYGKNRGSDFYSPYISDVDYLAKDNYLVHSGGIVSVDGKPSNRPAGFDNGAELHSTTVELLDNEVVFEMTLPNNMYRAEKMKPYNNSIFKLGQAGKLGTLGKTEPTKEGFRLPKGAIDADENYDKYKISFTNEDDRLVMNGTFKKEQDVSILLYKNYNIKEYPVRVSKKPYTALCIDIFTTEESEDCLEINKYINKEGLKGDYSIYMKIGDKLYNTGKMMNFDM